MPAATAWFPTRRKLPLDAARNRAITVLVLGLLHNGMIQS
jgi:hypothetical protein